jgi:ABC-2 type transport system ATP-binding protein
MSEPMTPLAARDLAVHFGPVVVLDGVDLALPAGAITGLIGPNGSGKTTLVRALLGLVPLTRGQVRVAAVDLASDPLAARARLGFAPDPALLPADLSGRQVLQVTAAARGLADVPADVLDLAARLGAARWLDAAIGSCSLGTRQKFAILMALLGRPPVLVLDEVMNGLDPISAHELKAELRTRCRDEGAAVLLATHGLEIAPTLLDHAVLLADGRIRHRWGPADFAAWRHGDPAAFERAVVAALRADA